MAEHVHFKLEETLGELEQMKEIGLFNGHDIKNITKKREKLYYRLQRRVKSKDDYSKLLEYEINLLKLVKKRRDLLGIRSQKVDIDHSIGNRINRYYKAFVFSYQSDVSLWQSYIKFLKWMGFNDAVSRIYGRMLQVHGNKPAVWIAAAKWEMKVLKAADSARTLMLQALRFHPKSKEIFLQYFEVELMYSDKINKRRNVLGLNDMENDEEASDAILQKKLAYVVFKSSLDVINDVDFHLEFLPVCKKYKDTENLQEEIFKDIQDRYSTEESMWNYLAKTHLIENEVELKKVCRNAKASQAEVLKKSYVNCFEVYQTAVEVIPTENMWSLYIAACLEGLKSTSNPPFQCEMPVELLTQQTLEAMKEANSRQLLGKQQYLDWVTVLKEHLGTEDIEKILSGATEKYSRSSALWTVRIENLIMNNADSSLIQNAFNDAITAVNDKEGLNIWMLAFKWTRIIHPQRLTMLFENSLTCNVRISSLFKPLYLEYVALNEDVTAARKLYVRLRYQHPICKEFFYKMFNIESAQLVSNIVRLRKILEELIEHYGKNEIKPWLDYINLEKTHSQGKALNIPKIHWRAIKMLDPSLHTRFTTAYSLMTTKGKKKKY